MWKRESSVSWKTSSWIHSGWDQSGRGVGDRGDRVGVDAVEHRVRSHPVEIKAPHLPQLSWPVVDPFTSVACLRATGKTSSLNQLPALVGRVRFWEALWRFCVEMRGSIRANHELQEAQTCAVLLARLSPALLCEAAHHQRLSSRVCCCCFCTASGSSLHLAVVRFFLPNNSLNLD